MLYRRLSAPLHAQVELTTKCNNRCQHCYNRYQLDANPVVIDKEKLERVIGELSKYHVSPIVLTGGEPLLYPDLVLYAAELCKKHKLRYSINTNLTVCDEYLFKSLLKLGDVNILTSIASYDKGEHDVMMGRNGAYDNITGSLRILVGMGVKIAVNMVLTSVNVAHVFETGRFVHDIGIRDFSATKVCCPTGCSDFDNLNISKNEFIKSLDDLLLVGDVTGMNVGTLSCYPHCALGDLKKYKNFARRHCSGGKTDCAISPQGDVRPCVQSDMIYGNILNEDISDIYKRMDEWRDGSLLPQKCLECPQFILCGGGCRYGAKAFGEISSMDVFATGPEDVVVHLSMPSHEDFDSDALIEVPCDLYVRKEDFGCIIYNCQSRSLMFDDEAGILIGKLVGEKTKISSIYDDVGISKRDEVDAVLRKLIVNGFAKIFSANGVS